MAEARSTIAETLNRALAAFRANDLDAALRLVDGVLSAQPRSFDALHLKGLVEMRRGRVAEAERAIAAAVAIQPGFAPAHFNRAQALAALGRAEEAVASYDRALALKPDHAEAWANRGVVLRVLNRPADALASFERAAALNPGQAGAWTGRGNVLRDLGRLDEAAASYDRAAALSPGDAALWSNRGSILHALNRLEEALTSYDKALALKPDFAEAWSNRGNVLRDLGRIAAALESHGRAQALKPGYAGAHWNEALCRLLAGDYAEGWRKFEWRWQREPLKSQRRAFAAPRWTGAEDLAGRTVLLHAEQGFGDTIQFCRYAPLVAARGARVVLEAQPALKSLLGSLKGVARVIARGEALPAFDFHCPLLSLPLAFGTTPESVPAEIPYLRPDAQAVARWTTRLAGRRRPLVAVAWAGNPAQLNDRNRSLAFAQLAPLFAAGAGFVSLQKDCAEADAAALARLGIPDLGPELADFSDTAAALSLADAVVSVDSAVAHLAGAMGRKLFVILARVGSDWRWLLEREDSPWYPTATLLRRKAEGDLPDLLGRIAREIEVLGHGGRAQAAGRG
jgi:tetratricopeptide (TPR) repeat protein